MHDSLLIHYGGSFILFNSTKQPKLGGSHDGFVLLLMYRDLLELRSHSKPPEILAQITNTGRADKYHNTSSPLRGDGCHQRHCMRVKREPWGQVPEGSER